MFFLKSKAHTFYFSVLPDLPKPVLNNQRHQKHLARGFPGGAVVENLPANAGDTGSSPGLGRSHMPRSNWAREPQLLSLRIWSLCSATREAATHRANTATINEHTITLDLIYEMGIILPASLWLWISELYSIEIEPWASLVAQWLRIHLPMQGTQVRALVWEDPTCHGATKPIRHN
ncbi:hypothetical protein J1605_001879 [Eschrichtius robustus]|uniref:Uncharacterized protein n=1 Tax=Eschrichtius robustus TaxID=9764 RepID=A0AB34I0G8_ESCRO|nr:hypothetical protein J1605_001879 [Eschrichtius robustus]